MKHEDTLNGAWLDFYALLSAKRDADANEMRRLIGACYADASQNLEHRDLGRRMYYQAMVERVLPQCRRVLLNPETRARYDEQHALHEADAPGALSYVEFMAGLSGATRTPQKSPATLEADAAPTASGEKIDLENAREAASPSDLDESEFSESGLVELDFNALPERVREDVRQEIDLARAVVETLEHGFAFDLLPSRAVTTRDNSYPTVTPPTATPPTATPPETKPVALKIAATSAPTETPAPRLPDDDASDNNASMVLDAVAVPVQAVLEAPEAKRPFKRGTWDSDAKIPRQRPDLETIIGVTDKSGLVQDDLTFDAERSRSQRKAARAAYRPRLILDEALPAHGARALAPTPAKRGPGASVLSGTVRLLLTSLVAALFVIVLQRDGSQPATASNRVEAPHTVVTPRVIKPHFAAPAKPRPAKKATPAASLSTPQSFVPEAPAPKHNAPKRK